MENNAFIGKGWAFPPVFQDGGKTVAIVQGEEEIEQSLVILFSTRFNERVLHHRFGTGFDDFIFEDISQSMVVNLKKMVQDAVDRYVPCTITGDQVTRTIEAETEVTVPCAAKKMHCA